MAAMKTRKKVKAADALRGGPLRPGRDLLAPPLAALCSAIVPGLGQALNGLVQRGLLVLASTGGLAALLVWRIDVLAHREKGLAAQLAKAFDLNPGFIAVMAAGLAGLWVWAALDAWSQARRPREERMVDPLGRLRARRVAVQPDGPGRRDVPRGDAHPQVAGRRLCSQGQHDSRHEERIQHDPHLDNRRSAAPAVDGLDPGHP